MESISWLRGSFIFSILNNNGSTDEGKRKNDCRWEVEQQKCVQKTVELTESWLKIRDFKNRQTDSNTRKATNSKGDEVVALQYCSQQPIRFCPNYTDDFHNSPIKLESSQNVRGSNVFLKVQSPFNSIFFNMR